MPRCGFCNRFLQSERGLIRHVEYMHSFHAQSPQPGHIGHVSPEVALFDPHAKHFGTSIPHQWGCYLCGKDFNSSNSHMQHMEAAHGVCPWQPLTRRVSGPYDEGESLDIQQVDCILYFNGIAKPNTDIMGVGWTLQTPQGALISQGSCQIRSRDSNENAAAYCALMLGMESVLARGFHRVEVRGSAEIVINQMNSGKCYANNLVGLFMRVKQFVHKMQVIRFVHIDPNLNAFCTDFASAAADGNGLVKSMEEMLYHGNFMLDGMRGAWERGGFVPVGI